MVAAAAAAAGGDDAQHVAEEITQAHDGGGWGGAGLFIYFFVDGSLFCCNGHMGKSFTWKCGENGSYLYFRNVKAIKNGKCLSSLMIKRIERFVY